MSAGNHTIVNMVFCAYCGKSFTRKEHLERHIPSHTNVKPHRCTNCQLSFARRDLLQRHYATYHEIRDPSLPLPASIPSVAGRTPIACLNCASAKTGCDKRVPCSRCADKSLPCAARFARRSSKLIARAMAASEASSLAAEPSSEKPLQALASIATSAPKPKELAIDPRLQSPPSHIFALDSYGESTSAKLEGFDSFIQYNDGFGSPEMNYQDLLTWNDFPIDMELYGEHSHAGENSRPMYSEEATTSSSSEISSISAGARLSAAHTRRCSGSSADGLDFEDTPPSKRQKLSPCAVGHESEEVSANELAQSLARCDPPAFSSPCPRAAVVLLENSEQDHEHSHGSSLNLNGDRGPQNTEDVGVGPVSLGTRDTLHAVTQAFLHRALKALDYESRDCRLGPCVGHLFPVSASSTSELAEYNFEFSFLGCGVRAPP